jgi:L-asparaginase
MENVTIRVISTGGTFDKVYDQKTGELSFDHTHIHYILNKAKLSTQPELSCPFLVDSLDMNDSQRQQLIELIQQSPEKHLIITHGTDTMIETAKTLTAAKIDKTVVLTGAMIPFDLHASDATFNFAYAYGVCQHLQPGVYLAMHGQVFDPENCFKDKDKSLFRLKK